MIVSTPSLHSELDFSILASVWSRRVWGGECSQTLEDLICIKLTEAGQILSV